MQAIVIRHQTSKRLLLAGLFGLINIVLLVRYFYGTVFVGCSGTVISYDGSALEDARCEIVYKWREGETLIESDKTNNLGRFYLMTTFPPNRMNGLFLLRVHKNGYTFNDFELGRGKVVENLLIRQID